jgi:diguanylate cyclase (GGDEF)-like protein
VLCIPIACRGETFGIIHLRDDAPGEPDTDGAAHSNRVEDRELGTTIGETLGLHLFNLSLREELSRESTRDPLTGVLNRRGLIAALNEHLDARAAGRNLAVLLLDVDHFKRVNDTHGHDVGDAVLTALARVVDSRIRDRDLLARWGGEEFIVVLPDTDLSTALLRAEQIRRSIARLKIDYEQTQLKDVTASIGVAARPQHARHWDDLVNIADKALYEAKQRGRNRVIEGAADVPPNNTIPFERKR